MFLDGLTIVMCYASKTVQNSIQVQKIKRTFD